MDRQKFKVVALGFSVALLCNRAAAVDIQHYTIGGAGLECFRFAILTDTHADQNAAENSSVREGVNAVIQINNDTNPRNDVSFVVILGDLIRGETRDDGTWKGETDYRLEYEQVKAELERLELPPPEGAGVHYIPLIGNHDVWFNFDDYTINDAPPDYPEELFAEFFGPQFDELRNCKIIK